MKGHVEIVRILAEKTNLDIQDEDGKTALMWAIEKNLTEIETILTEAEKARKQARKQKWKQIGQQALEGIVAGGQTAK